MVSNNKKRILIVDDNDEIRGIYVDLFKKNGFDVLEAKDGVEGLDMATSEEGIEAVFTGIIMPRMDGFQMMEALKKQTATANIPIFINSHLGREEDRKKATDLGAKDFIVNGIVPPIEAVNEIIRQLEGGEYYLKIDPYELDGQRIINNLNLPEELICDNCGTALAVKIAPRKKGVNAEIVCPNCKKRF